MASIVKGAAQEIQMLPATIVQFKVPVQVYLSSVWLNAYDWVVGSSQMRQPIVVVLDVQLEYE